MNKIFVTGRLTKDANLRSTQDGKQVLNFDFAVRDDYKKDTKKTLFLRCAYWGDRAGKIVEYLTKGKFIAVTGRLEIRKTESETGVKYCNHEIVVQDIEFLSPKSETTTTVKEPEST